jgi:hypothetical protein
MIGDSHAVALAATPRIGSRGFFVTLALITLVSLIGVPLALTAAAAVGGAVPGGLTLLAITGPMHVAATSYFYFDRDFWPVLRESRLRSFWSLGYLPLGMPALGVAGTAIIGPWAYLLMFSGYSAWLFYHYQRQNFGLISLVSTNVGCGRLPPSVNTTLNLAALAGIVSALGMPGFYPSDIQGLLTPHGYLAMRMAGTAVYVFSLVQMMRVFRKEPRLRESAWLIGGLVLGMLFFLPAVAFQSTAFGFLPYAVAHGAQYIFMMSILSGRSRRGWWALLTMCALGVTIGSVLNRMTAWPAVLVVAGVTQVHFLIDAKVWRLSERKQRAIMNDRFDFLFAG